MKVLNKNGLQYLINKIKNYFVDTELYNSYSGYKPASIGQVLGAECSVLVLYIGDGGVLIQEKEIYLDPTIPNYTLNLRSGTWQQPTTDTVIINNYTLISICNTSIVKVYYKKEIFY